MSVTALIGMKAGMTSVFDASGAMVGVSVVRVQPNRVLARRTAERDGYDALVLGSGSRRATRARKPQRAEAEKAGFDSASAVVREVRVSSAAGFEVGATIGAGDVFEVGQYVDVVGTSIGRGFQGTARRYGFNLGPRSHGSKNWREPGSTGNNTFPGRVWKGKRMPGHMGNRRRTQRNLRVVGVDAERGLVMVCGSVPGAASGIVTIRHAVSPPRSARPARKG